LKEKVSRSSTEAESRAMASTSAERTCFSTTLSWVFSYSHGGKEEKKEPIERQSSLSAKEELESHSKRGFKAILSIALAFLGN